MSSVQEHIKQALSQPKPKPYQIVCYFINGPLDGQEVVLEHLHNGVYEVPVKKKNTSIGCGWGENNPLPTIADAFEVVQYRHCMTVEGHPIFIAPYEDEVYDAEELV